jgi:hypothetical protein
MPTQKTMHHAQMECFLPRLRVLAIGAATSALTKVPTDGMPTRIPDRTSLKARGVMAVGEVLLEVVHLKKSGDLTGFKAESGPSDAVHRLAVFAILTPTHPSRPMSP